MAVFYVFNDEQVVFEGVDDVYFFCYKFVVFVGNVYEVVLLGFQFLDDIRCIQLINWAGLVVFEGLFNYFIG